MRILAHPGPDLNPGSLVAHPHAPAQSRRPAADARLLATDSGWAAFTRIRRRVPARFRQVRVVRTVLPTRDTAEIVAMVENGTAHQAMTFTFRATQHGWRLDHCDLVHADNHRQR